MTMIEGIAFLGRLLYHHVLDIWTDKEKVGSKTKKIKNKDACRKTERDGKFMQEK